MGSPKAHFSMGSLSFLFLGLLLLASGNSVFANAEDDGDTDDDGVLDSADEDDDNDGIEDAGDTDDDGDNVPDEEEDTDGDGMSNSGIITQREKSFNMTLK